MNPGDLPAFPDVTNYEDGELSDKRIGLTKREKFAESAMQGLIAGISSDPTTMENFVDGADEQDIGPSERLVRAAVKYADALLAELAKPQEDGK